MKAYIINCLVAFDQFCNVVLGGNPDETISARCGRNGNYLSKAVRWVLNAIQPGHCEAAIEHDEQRAAKVVTIEDHAELSETTPEQR